MLDVDVDKILPVTEARDSLNKIVDEVGGGDGLYVVTKNGKPQAIVVGVHHLEKLTGIDHKEIMPDEETTEGTNGEQPEEKPTAQSEEDELLGPEPETSDTAPVMEEETIKPMPDSSSSSPSGVTANNSSNPDAAIAPISEAPAPTTTPATDKPSMEAPGTTSPSPGFTVPAVVDSSAAPVASDSVDDIFGPEDEDASTAAPGGTPTPPAPVSTSPAATTMPPMPSTPPSTLTPPAVSAAPAPTTPSVPPTTPGQM